MQNNHGICLEVEKDFDKYYTHCMLDSLIMTMKVGRVNENFPLDSNYSLLNHLKKENFKLLFWNKIITPGTKKDIFSENRITTNLLLRYKITGIRKNFLFSETLLEKNLSEVEYKNRFLELIKNNIKHSHLFLDKKIKVENGIFLYYNWIRDALLNKNNRRLIAIKNKNIDAFAVYTLKSLEQEININLLIVDKSSRSKGYGRYLIDKICETSRLENIKTIALTTQLENEDALAFYKKYGFKEIKCYNVCHYWL